MILKHPKDWLAHCALLISVTFISGGLARLFVHYYIALGLTCGITTSIIKEATQIEDQFIVLQDLISKHWWKTIVFTRDRIIDLVSDGVGVTIGYFLLRSL